MSRFMKGSPILPIAGAFRMWAIISVMVVLPLVPVIAINSTGWDFRHS